MAAETGKAGSFRLLKKKQIAREWLANKKRTVRYDQKLRNFSFLPLALSPRHFAMSSGT
ncbi:MAG: hypothetical protein IJU76_08940 [Desulfovibrionaceae bacterium]|nr:hypothetical protein [Desulfovibrionaceae bacterium]